jgi:hypothetical protein
MRRDIATTPRILRTARRSAASAAIVMFLVVSGCTADRGDATDATDDGPGASEDAETDAADDPTPEELRFVFTGERGDDGCLYEGATTMPAGRHASTFTHEGADDAATVTLSRLADGHTYEDFLDYLAGLTDTYPAPVPPEDTSAGAHDWMEGEWREIHQAEPGEEHALEALMLSAGRFVTFCWTENGDEAHVWPATELTLTE